MRDKQIEERAKELYAEYEKKVQDEVDRICGANYRNAGYRKSTDVARETIDKFRDAIMDAFLSMCCYNDYNKINLLQIGDTVDSIYDKLIEKIEEQYNE